MMADAIIDQTVYQILAETVGKEFLKEMVEAFLEESAQFLADLSSALEEQDVDGFRRAAHSLKSNAATFGAITLSELAKELEDMARENRMEDATSKIGSITVAFSETRDALEDLQNG